MYQKIRLIIGPILAILLLAGCKVGEIETKSEQSGSDGGGETSQPVALASKYCAPYASTLEFKNGRYWFSMDGRDALETEGGFSDGELSLTAAAQFQDDILDVSIVGKPDGTGQNLTLEILVSKDGQKYFGQKMFAQAAADCPTMEMSNLPQIAGTSFDLNQVHRITRYRSSYGHSYTDSTETCRSMKHYFEPKQWVDRYIKLYAPFKARIVAMYNESGPNGDDGINNQRLVLQSVDYPALQFDYFHFELNETVKLGSIVEAGTELGWGDMYRNGGFTNSIDIAVWVSGNSEFRLVSMFDVLSTDALAQYNAWSGLSVRSDYQLSKTDRDANPIQCENQESFVDEENEPFYEFNWVYGL